MNNGKSTGYFSLERGARQGHPLSACLFILALQVRSSDNIEGISINEFILKLTAYADDAYYFIKNIQSLQGLFQIFCVFEEFSSLKINPEKCEACWIGSTKHRTETLNCKWTSLCTGSIKVLGNYISYNMNLANKLNFSSLIPSINNIINLWKQRNLTIARKIQVFRSLVFSELTFISSMNSVPRSLIDDLQKIHKDFIWGGRKPKIKHSSLIGEYKDGGLRDVDILSSLKSLKVSWIRRLFDDNFHPWKLFTEHFLRLISGKYIFHENLKIAKSVDGLVKELPEFYRNLLSVWAQNLHIFITSEINHPTEVLKQQL